jgi:hypothetical protein
MNEEKNLSCNMDFKLPRMKTELIEAHKCLLVDGLPVDGCWLRLSSGIADEYTYLAPNACDVCCESIGKSNNGN